MKNIETPSKKHLGAIITDLGSGAYVIPDFQREFEWGPGDVNELIRSIFEDFYIGTILLWRATKENLTYLKCEPLYGYTGNHTPGHIVLDGQQRLSALYYAFFAPDKPFPRRRSRYYFFIDIPKLLDDNFDQAFIYQYGNSATAIINDQEKLFSQKLLPLKIFGETPHAWYKWLDEYEKYWSSKGDETVHEDRTKLEGLISELLADYYVSYIELDREIPVEKVCDIFTRINNTGIALDIFDLLNALLRPKDINLKDKWRLVKDKLEQLPKIDTGKLILLQTISILQQEYCAPKYLYFLVPGAKKKTRKENGTFEEQVLIPTKEDFDELWDKSVGRNLLSLKMLSNPADYGAIVPKFMPYPTMLPIFTVLNIEKEKPDYQNKNLIDKKIHAWYWSSIFTNNYSSSVESQMAQDLREMRLWFLDDIKTPGVVRRFKRVVEAPDFFEKLSPSSAIYKGIFCLIARRGAKDFYSWKLPEYSSLDDHHIVPESWGKRNSVDTINSILNRTPISDETNRKIISDRLPNEYIQEMVNKCGRDEVYKLFDTHLVPFQAVEVLLRKPFTQSDFAEYISLRQAAIRQEILKLFDDLPILEADDQTADVETEERDEEFLLDPGLLLFCKSSEADAKANPGRGKKLRVLKGSRIVRDISPGFGDNNYNKNIREYLLKEGVITKDNDGLVFSEDYEFASSSAAAAVILGRSANGQVAWKDEAGIPLSDLYQKLN